MSGILFGVMVGKSAIKVPMREERKERLGWVYGKALDDKVVNHQKGRPNVQFTASSILIWREASPISIWEHC